MCFLKKKRELTNKGAEYTCIY